MATIHFDQRGDFYNAFHQDARVAAPVLGLALMKVGGADMIGLPKYAIQGAIETLNAEGHSVKFNRHI